jgi:hypothetical protein
MPTVASSIRIYVSYMRGRYCRQTGAFFYTNINEVTNDVVDQQLKLSISDKCSWRYSIGESECCCLISRGYIQL